MSRVFPETHSVLSELKRRGFSLGIISNNTDEIFDRMESLDLVRYFDTITYSQEAGAEKPDPAPFRLALQRANRAPWECLHVEDSYEMDVVGARGVGIEPILVDRKMKHSRTARAPETEAKAYARTPPNCYIKRVRDTSLVIDTYQEVGPSLLSSTKSTFRTCLGADPTGPEPAR
jgi:FMN phosphatase YigB (HAD superfamily)